MSICALAVVANTEDYFVMGNSFLRSYYTIHDDTQVIINEEGVQVGGNRLGIIPGVTSRKEYALEFTGRPEKTLDIVAIDSVWTWVVEGAL